MKVWLVSVGEYSDYRVLYIFDENHRIEAAEAAELIGGRMEEDAFELNSFLPDKPPAGMRFFVVEMNKSGHAEFSQRFLLTDEGKLRETKYFVRTHKTDPIKRKSYWRLYVYLYARDKQHAVKIANEIRVQILAGAKPMEGTVP